jgi:hypothetical protein
MNKVLADGTLGISADDKFDIPAGLSPSDCTGGGQNLEAQQEQTEEYFFE